MKRALQFAAGILALVLAMQPVLAATCGMALPKSCPMAMGTMSPDCPMAQQMAEVGMQDCCSHASRTAVPAVAPAKRRVGKVIGTTAAAVPVLPAAAPRPATGSPAPVSSSPRRYILHQVFRI